MQLSRVMPRQSRGRFRDPKALPPSYHHADATLVGVPLQLRLYKTEQPSARTQLFLAIRYPKEMSITAAKTQAMLSCLTNFAADQIW